MVSGIDREGPKRVMQECEIKDRKEVQHKDCPRKDEAHASVLSAYIRLE